MTVVVSQAGIDELEDIVDLFDRYRVFYKQDSDTDGARKFLKERFICRDTVLLFARENGMAAGFAHLFPSFTSTGMRRIYILNDLFVSPEFRQRSIGSGLLRSAADYARKAGAARLSLATANDNHTAQRVYEHCGWTKDTEFLHYNLPIP